MIVHEDVAVDASEPGLIGVHHTELHAHGLDMSSSVWFERDNLDWVRDVLAASLTRYAQPIAVLSRGADTLRIHESGHEQEPCTNILNRRPPDATRPGPGAVGMRRSVALRLLRMLAAIR